MERLLWRAGFGPRPGDVERLAKMSLKDAVYSLTRPSGPATLSGPEPRDSNRWYPNENYARELMELFTLGAGRGAYGEADVRELARALTGWRATWTSELGSHNFRFDTNRFDSTNKTVFGR